jgi:hypothetical protein
MRRFVVGQVREGSPAPRSEGWSCMAKSHVSRSFGVAARVVAVAAVSAGLVAVGSRQAMGDPPDGQGSGGPPSVHHGGNGQKPDAPPNSFNEAPHGYEVSFSNHDDIKHHWPNGFDTGGTTVESDSNDGGATGGSAAFPGPVNNGWIPYDAAVAVGPTHVVVLVNSSMTFYDKSDPTNAALTQYSTFDSWWGTSAGTAFDPKCYYDPAMGGHFVMQATSTGNGLANMYIAVSQTTDPTGDWWNYTLDWRVDGSTMTNNWGDFPGLGYDDAAVYVTANQYNGSGFKYAKIRVLDKSQLYTGGTLTFTDFTGMKNSDGSTAFTVKPARCLSTSGSEYLLNTRPMGGSSVTLWRIDNAPAAPTLTRVANVSVGTYGPPPDAPQLGGHNLVATGDCRTQEIVYRSGNLYTGFSERFSQWRRSTVSAVRFLKVTTAGVKVKDTTYTGPTGVSFYYPAVTVDAAGDVAMGFNRSSSTEYISSNVVKLLAAASNFSPSVTLKAGTSYMIQPRWGDYNAIQMDPDGTGAWVMNGVGTNTVWGTDVTRVSMP